MNDNTLTVDDIQGPEDETPRWYRRRLLVYIARENPTVSWVAA